jgi:2-methylcitrate dehydratase PrpD
MTQDGNARAIGFIHGLDLAAVPPEVIQRARICLLDLAGACLAGADIKGTRILLDFAASQMAGAGEATVIRAGRKLPRVAAALVNGFIANALDIDDGYRLVKGHPGAAVFPVVLAAAENEDATGKALLEALIVGYEIAIRAGVILHGHYGFYHGSGSWGAIGSAAGVVRLLGLSPEQTGHALGIAESYAPLVPEIRAVEHPSMAPKDGIPWGGHGGDERRPAGRQRLHGHSQPSGRSGEKRRRLHPGERVQDDAPLFQALSLLSLGPSRDRRSPADHGPRGADAGADRPDSHPELFQSGQIV